MNRRKHERASILREITKHNKIGIDYQYLNSVHFDQIDSS